MAYQKAKIIPEEGDEFEVMFNPQEYSISRSVSYSDTNIPGKNYSVSQYISGSADTLSMTLIFNTYDFSKSNSVGKTGTASIISNDTKNKMNVADSVNKLVSFTKINSDLHRPPICEFKWSGFSFKGVIVDIKHNYTMFLDDGTPVRAKVDVTFKSIVKISEDSKETRKNSPDRTKGQTLHEGVQLWNIADAEYDDPSKWREIAKANGITNPLDIYAGMKIKIPAI